MRVRKQHRHQFRPIFELMERRVLLAAFVVNSVADTADANPNDGTCEDFSGNCSLRAAIAQANLSANSGGADQISFNIPGSGPHIFIPASDYPSITDAVIIDGYTQPGASPNTASLDSGDNAQLQIVIDGRNVGKGLEIQSDGSTIRGLAIHSVTSGGIGAAISLQASSNQIQGNFIGFDISGSPSLNRQGIYLVAASNNIIGGSTPADRNLFANSTQIHILADSKGTQIIGNHMGVDTTGTSAIADPSQGILIDMRSHDTRVGGSDPAEGNLIVATSNGTLLSVTDSQRTVVQGNRFSTNAAGTNVLGLSRGITIGGGSTDTEIGGSGAGEGNLIASLSAIWIQQGGQATIQGNKIGTEVTGTIALGTQSGITIASANNIVGGTLAAEGNLVAARNGISISSGSATGNTVQGNSIGTDPTGTLNLVPVGFSGHGVAMTNGASNNLVGGTVPSAGNRIGFSQGNGVRVLGSPQNQILGNRIFGSARLPIEISASTSEDGVTTNDVPDADGVPNTPVLSSAMSGSLSISGSLESKPSTTYRIEFFASASIAEVGQGYGERFIGSRDVATNGSGVVNFTTTFANDNTQSGQYVSATATDTNGSTSEFSHAIVVDGSSPRPFIVTNTQDGGFGSLRGALNAAALIEGTHLISFEIPRSDPNFLDVDSGMIGGDVDPDVFVFQPTSAFPIVTKVSIDGSTQTAFGGDTSVFGPEISIDGSGAGDDQNGLTLRNATHTELLIRGLNIHSYSKNGIENSLTLGTGPFRIDGSYVGTDPTGTLNRGNGQAGVHTFSKSQIGGTDPDHMNVISGNGLGGVIFDFSSDGSVMEGNRVGTDSTGTQPIPNAQRGVMINFGNGIQIGGTETGAGNLISGNDGPGIEHFRLENTDLVIQGNYIGTDRNGTVDLGNSRYGIQAAGDRTIIGGTAPSAGNLISGNDWAGVRVYSGRPGDVPTVFIDGNLIGTDASGLTALGNSHEGISVNATEIGNGSRIGSPGAGNVIGGNSSGIALSLHSDIKIQSNMIGVGIDGLTAVGNTGSGIHGRSGPGVLVGGTAAGEGNVISANLDVGVNGDFTIRGNRIGTDQSGTVAVPNNGGGIVALESAVIGGSSPGAGNTISGNTNAGISIVEPGVTVQGNLVGIGPAGTQLGNFHGIVVNSDGPTIIGGTAPGESNEIAHNQHAAVWVQRGGSHTIRGNSLFGNGSLGIDLGSGHGDGPTSNDQDDTDTGPNGLQNSPEVSSVTLDGSSIAGTLQSMANTTFSLDFYATSAADHTGFGEGKRFLGSTDVTTDTNGDANFDVSFAIQTAEVVTATATDPVGNTSEFSAAFQTAEMDFGDAPETYDTLGDVGRDGGARHIATGVLLGTQRDTEFNANLPHDGFSDDTSGIDDEDGVLFQAGLALDVGSNTALATISGGGGLARLYGWIDSNGDGDFHDDDEQIARGDTLLSDGTVAINFDLAGTGFVGNTFARFRVSTEAGLGPDGLAVDGEVEDYSVCIVNSESVAVAFCQLSNSTSRQAIGASVDAHGSTVSWQTGFSTGDLVIRSQSEVQSFGVSPKSTSIRDDGSLVAFWSQADVAGQNPNFRAEVFLLDTSDNSISKVSNRNSFRPPHSSFGTSGPYLPFVSGEDLTGQNGDRSREIFLQNTDTNEFFQVTNSNSAAGYHPTVDASGNMVAFGSALDLTGQNGDNSDEVFLVDRLAGTATQITTATTATASQYPVISGDGSTIAFFSAGDLTGANPSQADQVFVYDVVNDTLRQATSFPAGTRTDSSKGAPISIDHDGSTVVFNAGVIVQEIYLLDVASFNVSQITTAGSHSAGPDITPDGTRFVFSSDASLSGNDVSGLSNVYLALTGMSTDLSLTLNGDRGPVYAGDQVTYTATIRNDSSTSANNVQFQADLPTAVSFEASNPGTPDCMSINGTLTCVLNTLAAGAETTVTFDVQVVPQTSAGDYTTSASVTADERDATLINNSAIVTTSVLEATSHVTTSMDNGRLTVRGDRGPNRITLHVTDQQVTVEGLNGTRVDGFASVVVDGVTNGMLVTMARGDDHVQLSGTDVAEATPNPIRVIGGRGDDVLELTKAWEGELRLTGGRGDDRIVVMDALLSGRLFVSGNIGDDTIEIVDSQLSRFRVQSGDDDDLITIDDSEFTGTGSINLGRGDDQLEIERQDRSSVTRRVGTKVRFNSRMTIRGGDGTDNIFIGRNGVVDQSAVFASNRRIGINGGLDADILDAGVLSNPNAHGNEFARRPVLRDIEDILS